MLRLFRRKPTQPEASATQDVQSEQQLEKEASAFSEPEEQNTTTKTGLFARLSQGLRRTRENFTQGLANLFLGKKVIDEELLEELEAQLISADIGVEATTQIIAELTQKVARKELTNVEALVACLRKHLEALLMPCNQPLVISAQAKPYVILMVGVNGSGKTTTIGKLAKRLQLDGKKVLLAAGDTFRAAAVEQLQVWGERNQIPVIAQQDGADSASVIFDAINAAQARGYDVVIADTAGRLHTQNNLMDELKKIKRVISKLDPQAPHEIMLIIDAGIGQNALIQAQQFHQAIGLSSLTVTKLDGTAKGGIIFAIAKKMSLPIRYIGVGEKIDDLRPFIAKDFVDALFSENTSS
jgi:fused signal recognition particle receptor